MSAVKQMREAAAHLREWWPDCDCHIAERAVADWLDFMADKGEVNINPDRYLLGWSNAISVASAYSTSHRSGEVKDGQGSTNLLPNGADDAPEESKEGQDGPSASPLTTHKPGADGLFATTALCGAFAMDVGVLRMHEWQYDCPVCAHMAGERP